MGKNAFAILVTLMIVIFAGWLVYEINITPQELSGYSLELKELTEGESFVIAPLSPSVESANVVISVESDEIFLLAGEPEIIGLESRTGYSYEGDLLSGQWQVLEGDDIRLVVSSETALKITAERGGDYHFWPTLLVVIMFALIWIWLMVTIYF